MKLKVGARSSPLSRAQADEILLEMRPFAPDLSFEMVWTLTAGDKDKATSLRTLGKSDFFTRELDEMLLRGEIDAAIHSAKDLPSSIPQGLQIAAITRGVDPRDVLVLRSKETLQSLREGAVIATSSERREEAVSALKPGLRFSDLRGTIGERLAKLQSGEADGVVIAEAALIRLKLTHLNRIYLPGPAVPLQGKLAILIRSGEASLAELFRPIDDPVSRP